MRKSIEIRVLLAVFAAGVAIYAVYASFGWPFRTALFPRLIAIPLFLLAIAEVVMALTLGEQKNRSHAVDFELTNSVEPALAARRTLSIIVWIFGFLVLILAAGFPLAVPIFVFLYLKLAGRESWGLAVVLTFVAWILVEGLFVRFLNIPFANGWIAALLSG